MNTFLLIDKCEDYTIGIITTKMDYNEFEIELYNAQKEFNEVDYDTYENFYDQVFGIMWNKGFEFEVTYIDKKIYI
jgi:hypothetical protein